MINQTLKKVQQQLTVLHLQPELTHYSVCSQLYHLFVYIVIKLGNIARILNILENIPDCLNILQSYEIVTVNVEFVQKGRRQSKRRLMQYVLNNRNKRNQLLYLDKMTNFAKDKIHDNICHFPKIVSKKILTKDTLLVILVHEPILQYLIHPLRSDLVTGLPVFLPLRCRDEEVEVFLQLIHRYYY